MAYLIGLVNPIITPVYNLIFKHAIYPFKTAKNVQDLREATYDLLAKSKDVLDQIEIAKRQGLSATNEVQRWLDKVDTIKSEEEVIHRKYDQRYKIFGNCAPNCWSNYKISKDAAEKVIHVQACLGSTPSDFVVQLLPPSVQGTPCPSWEHQPSRDVNLQEALKCIMNDPVGIIGIWGPGGVGKTHLMKKINNLFVGKSFFDSIIFVTASKGCSVEKVQHEIVKRLMLRKCDYVESQANIISDFLKERSFLILLDDLWEWIDLQVVGIPYPYEIARQCKRKVVLTTRSKNVCGQMNARKYIKVACLQHDEAWWLFRDKVGQETLSSCPRIEPLARDLVRELSGLPLALITVGRAMCTKIDPIQWEFAIHHMQQSCLDNYDPLCMESVFHRLKFSYDSLRNDMSKQCFLACSLWPEDSLIRKDELVRCWIGLGLVDECDIQSSYRKAYSLIGDLEAACLLESVGGSSPYHITFVKMHDVIRDMALWISCGCSENNQRWIVHARVGKSLSRTTIPWSQAGCISLMWNQMTELPHFNLGACSMGLNSLCLQWNHLDQRVFGTLRNFSALAYLDLSWNRLKNIPEELCALVNLEYLNFSFNTGIYEVPNSFRSLTKLKFLYLVYTRIQKIPKEVISNLKSLWVLDLMTDTSDGPRGHVNYIPSIFGELASLTNLQAVHINVEGVTEYEFLIKAPNIPIWSLNLERLEETSAFCLPGDLLSTDLVRSTLYELTVGKCAMEQIIVRHELAEPNYHFDALNKLSLYYLESLKEITWKGVTPQAMFPRLTSLDVRCCRKLENISWVMYLPCLEQLAVVFCDFMKQAFVITENNGAKVDRRQQDTKKPVGTFPCLKALKHLEFAYVPELASICDSGVTFPSLESLVLSCCPKLNRLPFYWRSIPLKLKVLELDHVKCWEKLEWEDEDVKTYLLPFLRTKNQYGSLYSKQEPKHQEEDQVDQEDEEDYSDELDYSDLEASDDEARDEDELEIHEGEDDSSNEQGYSDQEIKRTRTKRRLELDE